MRSTIQFLTTLLTSDLLLSGWSSANHRFNHQDSSSYRHLHHSLSKVYIKPRPQLFNDYRRSSSISFFLLQSEDPKTENVTLPTTTVNLFLLSPTLLIHPVCPWCQINCKIDRLQTRVGSELSLDLIDPLKGPFMSNCFTWRFIYPLESSV